MKLLANNLKQNFSKMYPTLAKLLDQTLHAK